MSFYVQSGPQNPQIREEDNSSQIWKNTRYMSCQNWVWYRLQPAFWLPFVGIIAPYPGVRIGTIYWGEERRPIGYRDFRYMSTCGCLDRFGEWQDHIFAGTMKWDKSLESWAFVHWRSDRNTQWWVSIPFVQYWNSPGKRKRRTVAAFHGWLHLRRGDLWSGHSPVLYHY